MSLLTYLRDKRIDFQRWNYRRKQKRAEKFDAGKMNKAIKKAERLARNAKKAFWVIKLERSRYEIFTKAQTRRFFRKLGIADKVNIFQPSEYIIHIAGRHTS
jgi:hypothetical protein